MDEVRIFQTSASACLMSYKLVRSASTQVWKGAHLWSDGMQFKEVSMSLEEVENVSELFQSMLLDFEEGRGFSAHGTLKQLYPPNS